MNKTILIVLTFLISSCGISGLYYNKKWNKHTPDALFIELCNDGTFKFYVWQDVLGEGLEYGSWHRIKDTIVFEPVKQYSAPVTKVYSSKTTDLNTRLTFNAVHALGDTLQLGYGDTLIVDNRKIPIDSTGTVILDFHPENEIIIQPLFPQFTNLADTVFQLDKGKNAFDFYISRGEWQPFSYEWAKGKMIKRFNALYDIKDNGEIEKDFKWKRHKLGCGHIKNKSGT